MMQKSNVVYIWAVFLILGIILFSMQIHHTFIQIKKFKKDNNEN